MLVTVICLRGALTQKGYWIPDTTLGVWLRYHDYFSRLVRRLGVSSNLHVMH